MRLSIKKNPFPVHRVAIILGSRAAAIFLVFHFFFSVGRKIMSIFFFFFQNETKKSAVTPF